MIKKLITLFSVFLLIIPLALATFTLDLDENYTTGATVSFNGTCDEDDQIAFQLTTVGTTVWVAQEGVANNAFSTTYVPADAYYTLYSVCGSSLNNTFCVGDNCVGAEPVTEPAATVPDAGSSSSSSSSSSGGGRGPSECTSDWSCGAWSYCTNELIQTRICQDLNFCYDYDTMPETEQSCEECSESWICTTWDECIGDQNSRTCADEHNCTTQELKPSLSKSCEEEEAEGIAPAATVTSESELPSTPSYTYTEPTTPEYYTEPVSEQQPTLTSMLKDEAYKIWQGYKVFVIALPSILLIAILIIIILVHRSHNHGPASNMGQLHTYVQAEFKSGMSKSQIRDNLKSSGWTDDEISQAMQGLDDTHMLNQQPPIQQPPVQSQQPPAQ